MTCTLAIFGEKSQTFACNPKQSFTKSNQIVAVIKKKIMSERKYFREFGLETRTSLDITPGNSFNILHHKNCYVAMPLSFAQQFA